MISERWEVGRNPPVGPHTLGLAVIRSGIGENGNHVYDGHKSPLTSHLSPITSHVSQDEQAPVLLAPRAQFKRFSDFNTPVGAQHR